MFVSQMPFCFSGLKMVTPAFFRTSYNLYLENYQLHKKKLLGTYFVRNGQEKQKEIIESKKNVFQMIFHQNSYTIF